MLIENKNLWLAMKIFKEGLFPKFISFLLSFLSDNVLNIFLIGKTAFDQIRSRIVEASAMWETQRTLPINMGREYFIKHLLDDTRQRARLLLKTDFGSLLVRVNHALCRFRTTWNDMKCFWGNIFLEKTTSSVCTSIGWPLWKSVKKLQHQKHLRNWPEKSWELSLRQQNIFSSNSK